MAIVEIPYQPGLTADGAMEVFRRGFGGKYHVYKTHFFLRRDFVVKRNPLIGVGVKLTQKPGETRFVYTYMIPSPLLALPSSLLLGGVLHFLILRPSSKALEAEVRSFIENAPEFRGAQPINGGARSFTQDGLQLVFCTSCGTPLAGQARFCQACGAPVSVPGFESPNAGSELPDSAT
jgi:hypothetical protein